MFNVQSNLSASKLVFRTNSAIKPRSASQIELLQGKSSAAAAAAVTNSIVRTKSNWIHDILIIGKIQTFDR